MRATLHLQLKTLLRNEKPKKDGSKQSTRKWYLIPDNRGNKTSPHFIFQTITSNVTTGV